MDKRSLLFFFSLLTTLFLVQGFFAWKKQQDELAYNQKLHEYNARKKVALAEQFAGRTAEVKDLPLVALYDSADAEAPIQWGVRVEDVILTVQGSADLPETIYPAKEGGWSRASNSSRSLIIYSQSSEAALQVADWPELGSYDLQMVNIWHQVPTVGIATLDDGELSLPVEIPTEDAIALMKTSEGMRPLGVYRTRTGRLEPLSGIETLAVETFKAPEPAAELATGAEAKFYVLENPVMQLVFSDRGGALVELNLPFETEENEASVVRPIGFDHDIAEKRPENAHFPSVAHLRADASGKIAELPRGEVGGYYPLIRRDIHAENGSVSFRLPPQYYALNVVSEYKEVAEQPYQVKSFTDRQIVFETVQRHRRVTKTFTLSDDPNTPYIVDLSIKVDGDSRGLWLSSGVPEVELISNVSSPALKFRVTRNGASEVESGDLPKDVSTSSSINPDWLCNSNGFFGIIMDPLTEVGGGMQTRYVAGELVPSRLLELDSNGQRFKAAKLPGYQMLLPLPTKGATSTFRIYAGPLAESTLKAVDAAFKNEVTGETPEYNSARSFHGWKWLRPISAPFAKFLFFMMHFFHRVTDSWAFSIVLLTVVLRLMLYPLNSWSLRSMRRMQLIQPEVQAIQAKYKKDPKKGQLEVMQLYRDRGVNPLSGCFPIFIQIPFLIGMFDLLKSTFELRGAPFIPGWIDDLAAPDVLFSWDTYIFFIGNELHLLPILLGGVMFLQSRISSSAPKTGELTDQQKQQKMMSNMMMVMFTVMFYNFPSGLNIYWVSSMGLSILQQWWVNRSLDGSSVTPKAAPKSGKRVRT